MTDQWVCNKCGFRKNQDSLKLIKWTWYNNKPVCPNCQNVNNMQLKQYPLISEYLKNPELYKNY